MPEWRVLQGDCLEVLRQLRDGCLDSCITDPPYELGFMGKSWDKSGVAFDPATWREVLRVLKPGGHLLAFGGTRTYHRIACAIEDAGFEIRDSLHWVYGSGFPKSLDASKAIDKHLGVERDVIGVHRRHGGGSAVSQSMSGPLGTASALPLTAPATPEAEAWDGWGTALKPAHEPIIVARKPLDGTVAENLLEHGTGAIHVGACRVGTETTYTTRHGHSGDHGIYGGDDRKGARENPPGRWPPNLVLSHDPECQDDDNPGRVSCVEGCPVLALDQQSGGSKSRKGKPRKSAEPGDGYGMTHTGAEYEDSGGASRFFPIFYQAKPSRRERDAGCGGLPAHEGHELVDRKEGSAGVQNPRAGAGRTSGGKNSHPTVKSIALMRWLVRLVTPPDGVVLDPFCGSGSTGVAAILEGVKFLGIEMSEEYIEIARARISHASEKPLGK